MRPLAPGRDWAEDGLTRAAVTSPIEQAKTVMRRGDLFTDSSSERFPAAEAGLNLARRTGAAPAAPREDTARVS